MSPFTTDTTLLGFQSATPRWLSRLSEACRGEYHGIVNGVYFDLRHDLLSSTEWESSTIGTINCSVPDDPDLPLLIDDDQDLPPIWFPWFDCYIRNVIQQSEPEGDAGSKVIGPYPRRPPSRRWPLTVRSRRFGKTRPECFVRDVDSITIQRIVDERIGDEFYHPHDARERHVFLLVTRANGEEYNINRPMIYRGTQRLLDYCANHVDVIADRILSHYKIDSIGDIHRVSKDASYAYRALSQITTVNTALDNTRFSKRVCADSGALLGYLWAKAEAELNLKPLASEAIRAKNRSKEGGKNSGEARRKKAEAGWVAIATKMAMAIRQDRPGLSQDRLAEEISFQWSNQIAAPGHARLKQLVGEMERSGVLPRRSRG